jgi:hypothetical protein
MYRFAELIRIVLKRTQFNLSQNHHERNQISYIFNGHNRYDKL